MTWRKDAIDYVKLASELKKSTAIVYVSLKGENWSGSSFCFGKNRFMTNAHVVKAEKLGKPYKEETAIILNIQGKPVVSYPIAIYDSLDIAVLKTTEDIENVPILSFADSSKVSSGEEILSVGAPLGIENIATFGHIASEEREIEEEKVMFIDLEIAPGSSGSPIANLKGEIVGVAQGSLIMGIDELNYIIPSSGIRKWLAEYKLFVSYEGDLIDEYHNGEKTLKKLGDFMDKFIETKKRRVAQAVEEVFLDKKYIPTNWEYLGYRTFRAIGIGFDREPIGKGWLYRSGDGIHYIHVEKKYRQYAVYLSDDIGKTYKFFGRFMSLNLARIEVLELMQHLMRK